MPRGVPKGFREVKIGIPTSRCASGSIRVKKLSSKKRLLVCCPKGPSHWKNGRCKVGTRATKLQIKVK